MASETKLTKDDALKILSLVAIHGIRPIQNIIQTWKSDQVYTLKDLTDHTFKFTDPESHFE